MTCPAYFGGARFGATVLGGQVAGALPPPPPSRPLVWSGRDMEGNTVSGTVSVPVKLALRPASNLADGTNRAGDLNAFLASVPAGSVVDLGGMSIRADQTVTVAKALTILGGLIWTDDPTGDSSTIMATSTAARTRAHVRVTASNVTLSGVTVRGPNAAGGMADAAYVAALEAQHAFEISSASHVTIRGCTGSYIHGDGLYLGKAQFNTADPADVLVEDLHIHHNGRQGIGVAAGRRLTFRRPVLEEIRRTVMDTEPNDNLTVIEDVEVDGMRFGNHRLNWFSAASSAGVCRRIWVHDSAPTAPGLMSAGAPGTFGNESLHNPNRQGPWTLERNTADAPYGTPSGWLWTFTGIDGVRLFDNDIAVQGSVMHMGKATNCTGVEFSGNRLPAHGIPDVVSVTV